jgi:putative hemolysin
VQLGITSIGRSAVFGWGCDQRWIGRLADISGNIGKDSNHFGNDYRRNCYYIYNDYLWRAGSKAYRAALFRAGFGMARRSMAWVASISKSFVRLLSFSTHVILTLLRISEFTCAAMTEEEIAAGLEQGRQPGLMEVHEHQTA